MQRCMPLITNKKEKKTNNPKQIAIIKIQSAYLLDYKKNINISPKYNNQER